MTSARDVHKGGVLAHRLELRLPVDLLGLVGQRDAKHDEPRVLDRRVESLGVVEVVHAGDRSSERWRPTAQTRSPASASGRPTPGTPSRGLPGSRRSRGGARQQQHPEGCVADAVTLEGSPVRQRDAPLLVLDDRARFDAGERQVGPLPVGE
jgi:hypothetical protein